MCLTVSILTYHQYNLPFGTFHTVLLNEGQEKRERRNERGKEGGSEAEEGKINVCYTVGQGRGQE